MPLATHIRLPELTQKLGVCRSTVYKLIQQEGFPRPFKITRRVSAWNEDELQAYLERQQTQSIERR